MIDKKVLIWSIFLTFYFVVTLIVLLIFKFQIGNILLFYIGSATLFIIVALAIAMVRNLKPQHVKDVEEDKIEGEEKLNQRVWERLNAKSVGKHDVGRIYDEGLTFEGEEKVPVYTFYFSDRNYSRTHFICINAKDPTIIRYSLNPSDETRKLLTEKVAGQYNKLDIFERHEYDPLTNREVKTVRRTPFEKQLAIEEPKKLEGGEIH